MPKVNSTKKKIIKRRLSVSQDTSNRELKQRLRQPESDNETLRQNMAEVQTQYEAGSSRYQEEPRPETLNKLASNRAIADQEGDIEGTLVRCEAELEAVHASSGKAGRFVRDLKAQLVLSDDKNRQTIKSLEDKLKMSMEQNEQSDAKLIELSSQLSEMVTQRDGLIAARNDLEKKLEQSTRDAENKDAHISKQRNIILKLKNDSDRLREGIERMQLNFDDVEEEPDFVLTPLREPREVDRHFNVIFPGEPVTPIPPKATKRPRPLTPVPRTLTAASAEKAAKNDACNFFSGCANFVQEVSSMTNTRPKEPKFFKNKTQNPPKLPVQRSMRPKKDTTVYNFNEDSSDGSMLDPDEVNRRFGAFCRGEPFSPLPPRGIKRPRPVTPVPRALQVKTAGAKKAAENDARNFFSGCANFVQEVMSMTMNPKEA